MKVKTPKSGNKSGNKAEPLAILEDGTKVWGYNANGQPICNAALRNKPGRHCGKTMLSPNGRCKLHGGHTPPPGPLHPNYKHGEFSQFIPAAIKPVFESFLANPEYLSLKNQIAMSDTRLAELYQKLEEALDRGTLTQLAKVAGRMEEALKYEEAMQELETLRFCAHAVIDLAIKGRQALTYNREVRAEEEHRKTLVDVERKRIVEATRQVSAEDVMAAMSKLIFSIEQRVKDPETRLALAYDIDRIMVEASLPWNSSTGDLKEYRNSSQNMKDATPDFPDYAALDEGKAS